MFPAFIKNIVLSILLSGLVYINSNSQAIDHWETVVMASDIWRYFPGASEPPSSWADPGFDASTWKEGRGGFGYGDGDDATIIDPVASVYIRIKFNIIDNEAIAAAILHVDFDDGFVAYLNGHEIARENIGTAGIRPPYNEYAKVTSNEARLPSGGVPAGFIITAEVLKAYLVNGENTLALQVHNCNATSSDLSSTTFFSVGLSAGGLFYRPVPVWFTDPFDETSDLPILVIDTWGKTIPDKDKITAWCRIIDNGPGLPNSILDPGTDYDGYIGIETRGQSSLSFPKKSFSIETRDAAGSGVDVSLLGMPPEEDWVLYAPYSDKSLLRNALTFYLGSRMGGWQPRFRFCDLYLNGSYHGIYMLMEKIKRGEDRLDISNLKPDEIAGDDLTGGYIVKVDKTGGLQTYDYFTTTPSVRYQNARNYTFTYVFPKADEIHVTQQSYIKNFLTSFQNTLNGTTFSEPSGGYSSYLDADSFIDFQIVQELTNNVDGYRFSTFFYKKKDSKGGKLHAGPLWDFDLCYGNVNYSPARLSTSGWLYKDYGASGSNCMHWWARLMEDMRYATSFSERWKELRDGAFHTDSVMSFIDMTNDLLGSSIEKNFERWPILGKYVWPNSFIGTTHDEETDFLKDWISDRLNWMDENAQTDWHQFEGSLKRVLTVFPNPVKDKINFLFYLTYTDETIIELFDTFGRKLYLSKYSPAEAGFQELQIDSGHFPAGMYIIKITQGRRIIGTRNIIKTR